MKNVCLAGEPNKKERDEVTKIMEVNKADNYIILFKGITGRHDFKALYTYDNATGEVKKVYAKSSCP